MWSHELLALRLGALGLGALGLGAFGLQTLRLGALGSEISMQGWLRIAAYASQSGIRDLICFVCLMR